MVRFLFVVTLGFYALGFILGPIYFIFAVGLWLLTMNSWEALHKARSKQRMDEFHRQMNEVERIVRERSKTKKK